MSTPPLLRAALAYAERGWPVHPCRAAGKLPLLPRWPERATTDPAQLAAWWRAWPDANVGIATGPAAGLLVLDVDGDPAALLAGRALPHTPTQQTGGGGRQYLFRFLAELAETCTTRAALLPGVDTRGRGGYIVAPPSVHPSGRRYAWCAGYAPDDAPLADPPGWLLVELLRPAPALGDSRPSAGTPRGSGYVRAALERECAAVAAAPVGARNATLYRAAYTLSRLVARGQADGEAVAHALASAAATCRLPAAEITRTIRSAYRARQGAP